MASAEFGCPPALTYCAKCCFALSQSPAFTAAPRPELIQPGPALYALRALAIALSETSAVAGRLVGSKIVHPSSIDVGFAVEAEDGVLVPVIRNADELSLLELSQLTRELADKARAGKLTPREMTGSSFTISNMGMLNIENFTAIINPPEAAILAVGSVREEPVVKDGQVVPGLRMKATISVDHRVSDGAEAARFMQALEKYLEEPLRLLI